MTTAKKRQLVKLLNQAIEEGHFQIWAEDTETSLGAVESNWARKGLPISGDIWKHTNLYHTFASIQENRWGDIEDDAVVQLGYVTDHNPPELEQAI
jgi:hypothetical protein